MGVDYRSISPGELLAIFERLKAADKSMPDRRPNLEKVRSELLRRLNREARFTKQLEASDE